MMGISVLQMYFQHLKNRNLSGFPEHRAQHPAVAYTCAIALLASHGAIPRVFNAEINCAHVGDLGALKSCCGAVTSGKSMPRSGKSIVGSGKDQ